MRTREVVIGDQIFLEIVYEAPEERCRPASRRDHNDADEDRPRGRRIGELVPDSWQM